MKPVERWPAGIDRDEVTRLVAKSLNDVPRLVLSAGDWEFSFRPIPKPEHRVGVPSPSGAISIFPGRTAGGSDWGRVGDALKEKARRYGDLGQPYVIGLLPSAVFVDYEEIVSAIYGEPVFATSDDGSGGRPAKRSRRPSSSTSTRSGQARSVRSAVRRRVQARPT